MANKLFYGDNLSVLRKSIADESIDLVYLDPPFNSDANYNVLFRAPGGEQSAAQIEAFQDTWHWTTEGSERAFDEVMSGQSSDAAIMLRAMRSALGESDTMAYLAMMAVRLIELHRVLKPTGSLYLHCDPTASHYLKILVDAIFGGDRFVNEIIWKRYGAHNDVGQGSRHYGRVQDTILFYSKTKNRTWNQLYTPQTKEYIEERFTYKDTDGRRYTDTPLTGPGGAEKGNPVFEWNGHTRAWRISKQTMQELHDAGQLHYTKTGYVRGKLYLDQTKGVPVQSIWTDIASLSGKMPERLDYPTQKPVALLERIIATSTNPGDVVLDPFCGCGTAVHAAQKLGREWVGIDVTHLAVGLIERRLVAAFPGLQFQVIGVPHDYAGARDLALRDKHEFQKWITGKIGAQPYKGGRKGMDRGIDGYLHFRDADKRPQFAIVSVKGGGHKSGDVRDLKGTLEREKAALGLFLTLNEPTREMNREAAAAGFYETGGMKFPKVQILTAAQIIGGAQPKVPFSFTEGFKKAARETGGGQGSLL
ncbi:Modification methylase MboII [Methylobacterium bullatum]|uniref:site-specific DNA-methyltransferase (adenine-specific) n=1 Tax=Methylobacterium bullatum TaxID=570505 RepID=A0A679IPF8_9HYPH|nr:Modification methylase MboII [Methylobacterium bullatum]